MSLGGLYDDDGWLQVDENAPIVGGSHGIPYVASGAIAVTDGGTPVTSGNGFNFDSGGRLCVTSTNAIAGGYAGLPFDSSGRLCITKQGPTHSVWPVTLTPTSFPSIAFRYEFGLKFQATVAGSVLGVRYYKNPGDIGTAQRNLRLWTAGGTEIIATSIPTTQETAAGWQTVMFGTPTTIAPNTTYIVSHNVEQTSGFGYYCATLQDGSFLNARVTNGPLFALADGESGPNAIYTNTVGGCPDTGYQKAWWFTDVIFTTHKIVTNLYALRTQDRVVAYDAIGVRKA